MHDTDIPFEVWRERSLSWKAGDYLFTMNGALPSPHHHVCFIHHAMLWWKQSIIHYTAYFNVCSVLSNIYSLADLAPPPKELVLLMLNTSKTPFGATNKRARGWALHVRNCVGVLPTDLHGTLLTGPYPCIKFERNRPSRSWVLEPSPCTCAHAK